MRYQIIHETEGQLHIKLPFRRLTEREADLVYYGLTNHTDVISTHVFPRTASAVIRFQKGRVPGIRKVLDQLDFNSQEAIYDLEGVFASATNAAFKTKVAGNIRAGI